MIVASTEQLAAFVGVKQAELAVARAVESPPPPDDREAAVSNTPTEGIPARLADAEALLLAQEEGRQGRTGEPDAEEDAEARSDEEAGEGDRAAPAEGEETDARGLTKEEQEQVQELQNRDAEVRRHERAHASAAGPHGGNPSFEFQRGPDGRFYAVGGEVSIDVSRESDPAATIAKMEIVIRAALAPADPSGQDRAVASQARRLKAEAERELREEKEEEATRASEKAAERRGEVAGGEAAGDPLAAQRVAAAQSYGRVADATARADDPLRLVQSLTA